MYIYIYIYTKTQTVRSPLETLRPIQVQLAAGRGSFRRPSCLFCIPVSDTRSGGRGVGAAILLEAQSQLLKPTIVSRLIVNLEFSRIPSRKLRRNEFPAALRLGPLSFEARLQVCTACPTERCSVADCSGAPSCLIYSSSYLLYSLRQLFQAVVVLLPAFYMLFKMGKDTSLCQELLEQP